MLVINFSQQYFSELDGKHLYCFLSVPLNFKVLCPTAMLLWPGLSHEWPQLTGLDANMLLPG